MHFIWCFVSFAVSCFELALVSEATPHSSPLAETQESQGNREEPAAGGDTIAGEVEHLDTLVDAEPPKEVLGSRSVGAPTSPSPTATSVESASTQAAPRPCRCSFQLSLTRLALGSAWACVRSFLKLASLSVVSGCPLPH